MIHKWLGFISLNETNPVTLGLHTKCLFLFFKQSYRIQMYLCVYIVFFVVVVSLSGKTPVVIWRKIL